LRAAREASQKDEDELNSWLGEDAEKPRSRETGLA
jgi:hypothetical protein